MGPVKYLPLTTGEQGAGAGEPAGGGSLVQPAGSRGGGKADHPGLFISDRRSGTHQLHQLCRSGSCRAQQPALSLIADRLSLCPFISADYLASRCQASLDSMERLQSAREAFLADNTGEKLKVLTAFCWG